MHGKIGSLAGILLLWGTAAVLLVAVLQVRLGNWYQKESNPHPPVEQSAMPAQWQDLTIQVTEGEPMKLDILVNLEHPCPDIVPGSMVSADEVLSDVLSPAREGIMLDKRCAAALLTMLQAAQDEGVGQWILSSGYRDHAYQRGLYLRKLMKDPGYYQDPHTYPIAVMPPYASEHATGLAVDLSTYGYESLESSFDQTPQGVWLKAHCAEYGFILRYPKEKETITGVVYEPWHFRYVGSQSMAEAIMEGGLCLEEYLANP